MSETLIKVDHVSKKFCRSLKRSLYYGALDIGSELMGRHRNGELRKNEFWAVDDVSFELKRGECLGLIGHNGAGKSTLLKMLNGLIKPDRGSITMKGRVGALIELGTGFNPILTGRENIYNNGAVLGFSRAEIDRKFDAIVEFSEIGDFIDTPVQNYSSGMKVRLGFSVAAQMEPDVLLIDEVLAVGDIGFRVKCLNRVAELLQNCAVIFVSHSMPQISRICNKGIFLVNSKIRLKTDDIGELIQQYFNSVKDTNNSIVTNEFGLDVSKISFMGEDINRISEPLNIQSDCDLIIKFNVLIPKDITLFSIHFPIIDMQMHQVAFTTSLSSNFPIKNDNLNYEVQCTIPNVFSAGKYYLGITIIENIVDNSNVLIGRTLYKNNNCISFIIPKTALVTSAPVFLKSKWLIDHE